MVRHLSMRRMTVAVALALVAGYLDGCGFILLGGYFVSFMTGNTTRLAVDLAHVDWSAAGLAAALVVSFVLGVMAGTALTSPVADRTAAILGVITIATAAAALVASPGAPLAAGALLAFGMGAANTVLAQRQDISFGVTYMTGALVKVGQGIVRALRGGDRWSWSRHLLMWSAVAVGALAGGIVSASLGTGALWVAAAATGALTIAATVFRMRRRSRARA
ncbi:MAG: YoaK family protein [Microbacterium arborescens]